MIKKYLPTSLYGRTFLIVVVPVLILQIAVSIVFFDRHWSKMTERLAFAVTGEMLAAIEKYQQDPDSLGTLRSMLKSRLNLNMSVDHDMKIFPAKLSKQGWMHWRLDDAIEYDLSREIEKMTDIPFQIISQTNNKKVIVYFLTDNGVVNFTIPERRLFSSSSYIFILWVVGLSILLFSIAMIFMRNQIRPIQRLAIVAERLGRGISVGKLKPSGATEVRQAAEAFVKMQDRINQYITGRTTMLAGVSHDLRTPLTRMKLQLEMMGDTPDVDAMRADIHDMERMIEGYLSFAKGDGGEEVQRISLKQILDKIIDDARRLSLTVHDMRNGNDDIIVWVKPLALSRALENFIGNAKHYATEIQFDFNSDENGLKISIHDNGSGIPEQDLQNMLRPFVRGDESRNQKTGGVGLGLTIANDIIVSHGGALNLGQSNVLGGLKVEITLPL